MKLCVIHQVAFKKRFLITVVAFMLQMMDDCAVYCGVKLYLIHQVARLKRFLITVVAFVLQWIVDYAAFYLYD